MLEKSIDFTEMIQGMYPPTEEANVASDYSWLFCPYEIKVIVTVINCVCND